MMDNRMPRAWNFPKIQKFARTVRIPLRGAR